jgi:hypothetical protein
MDLGDGEIPLQISKSGNLATPFGVGNLYNSNHFTIRV